MQPLTCAGTGAAVLDADVALRPGLGLQATARLLSPAFHMPGAALRSAVHSDLARWSTSVRRFQLAVSRSGASTFVH